MVKTFSFTARKISPTAYAVREDSMLPGCDFGTVELRRNVVISQQGMGCLIADEAWVFVPNQEEMKGLVDSQIRLCVLLAEIRSMYVELWARWEAQADAEQWAEGAWLRAAEYNAQHQWEMEREDALLGAGAGA
jgi:hypothetical protein